MMTWHESGIHDYVYQKFVPGRRLCRVNEKTAKNSKVVLRLDMFVGTFLILLVGMLLPSTVFVLERAVHRW